MPSPRFVLSQFDTRKPFEKPIARAGPPLPETLLLLAPLAPTLEKLNLSYNKLRGTITDDITAFSKLTELSLRDMGLEGAFVLPHINKREHFDMRIAIAQGPYRSSCCAGSSSKGAPLSSQTTQASSFQATSASSATV